jgi:putative hydrolase of the HAD superfamily
MRRVGGPYKAVLFDAFRTLVDVGDLAPMMRCQSPTWRLAMRAVFEQLAGFAGVFGSNEFLDLFEAVTRETAVERRESSKEIPLARRYELALLRLGWRDAQIASVVPKAVSVHRAAVIANCRVTADAHFLVRRCREEGIRTAVVSNFDDAESLRAVLYRDGLGEYLDAICVSVEVGMRKPHAKIFEHALQCVAVHASDALFVGDSWQEDVIGPSALGMDVAWLNSREDAGSEGLPTFRIQRLSDLVPVLWTSDAS